MKIHPGRLAAGVALPLILPYGAQAQSNVTLYGVVDASVMVARKGGTRDFTMQSGTGATSRWGLAGSEDLGGGLVAAFQLESFFRSTTGVAGSTTTQGDASFFSRQANVSLRSHQWGQLKLGRQLPAQVNTALDTFAGVSGFSPYASLSAIGRDQGSGASIGDSRISNAVSYLTPERFPLGASVLYALRGNSNSGYQRASAYGTEIHYTNGPLYLQAQYMANNTDPTATLASFRNEWWGLAAQYKFDAVTVSYILHALVPKRDGYLNSSTHAIGITIPYGADTIRVSPVYRKVAGRSDLDSLALGLGYDRNLSKRTTLYARVGYVDNRSNAIGTLGPTTLAQPGDDLPVAALGMYVRF